MRPADTAVLESPPVVDADTLPDLIGWTLKPQGLCRDEACVIVPDRSALESDHGVDLRLVAELLGRPVAVDDTAGLVAIGAERAQRQGALEDRRAPDFSLPDLDGTWHALSDHRSKKKLLVAFSSW
ncbi:MAG: peroxiredoxin family protein [Ilumatobacter sp.]